MGGNNCVLVFDEFDIFKIFDYKIQLYMNEITTVIDNFTKISIPHVTDLTYALTSAVA